MDDTTLSEIIPKVGLLPAIWITLLGEVVN